jgi:ribosome-binding protein aMBF1 (putative translation factor)
MGFKRKDKKHPKKKLHEQNKLKMNIMATKNKNLKSLDQFIDEKIGKKGTKKREQFETEYETFKLGILIQQAREKKGLTQEQLAELAGTNKSYISKLERNLKDIRFSTLQRIITEGLGGKLNISIKFE